MVEVMHTALSRDEGLNPQASPLLCLQIAMEDWDMLNIVSYIIINKK
jgi:hypothetical protein